MQRLQAVRTHRAGAVRRPLLRLPRLPGTLRLVPVGAALILAAVTAGCGSSAITTETRPVGSFDRIEVSGGIGVLVHADPADGASPSVAVRAPENALSRITTEVRGDTLRIDASGPFGADEAVVTLDAPGFDGLTISGGATAWIEGIVGGRLTFTATGGSSVTATGAADTAIVAVSGGSHVTLDELDARHVDLDLSGGSVATVRASGDVSGSASGDSRAIVLGDGRLEIETTSGAVVTHER
jgi:Putative auto-transporter adhesin, head GIN domain